MRFPWLAVLLGLLLWLLLLGGLYWLHQFTDSQERVRERPQRTTLRLPPLPRIRSLAENLFPGG